MNRRNRKALTFKRILAQTASSNARCLMRRAWTANRLAKTINGKARALAYQVKTDALVTLTRRFPDKVVLRRDNEHPQMVVVAIAGARFGLHAPRQNFAVVEGVR